MLCHTSLFTFFLCPQATLYKTLTSLSTVFIKGHVRSLQLSKWPCRISFFTHVEPSISVRQNCLKLMTLLHLHDAHLHRINGIFRSNVISSWCYFRKPWNIIRWCLLFMLFCKHTHTEIYLGFLGTFPWKSQLNEGQPDLAYNKTE